MRVLASADYQQLLHAESACIHCDSGDLTKKCHPLDMEGVLSRCVHTHISTPHIHVCIHGEMHMHMHACRWAHPDGEACDRCPHCIGLPALTQLGKIANHLELIKPDDTMAEDKKLKQADFARMAFGKPADASVTRDRSFFAQSHASSCGKMRALAELLRIWKAQKAKVLLFSLSTQMLDILEDFVTREGYSWLRLDGSTSTTQVRVRLRLRLRVGLRVSASMGLRPPRR